MGRKNYGPAVKGGKVLYTSPAQINRFRRCPRSWAWKYVAKIPEPPPSAAVNIGNAGHAAQEAHFKAPGDLKKPVLEGYDIPDGVFPAQGTPGLMVEAPLDNPQLTIGPTPIPVVGYMDLCWQDGTTVNILDHKFKGDIVKWGSKESDLVNPKKPDGVQMLLYGAWAFVKFLDATWAKLTHAQYQYKAPRLFKAVSADIKLIDASYKADELGEEVLPRMQTVLGMHPAKVLPNYRACHDYGGCPYTEVCRKNDPNFPHKERRSDAAFLRGLKK